MTRAAQIGWWLEQVEAPRRAVIAAREERRRQRPAIGFEDEPREQGRAGRSTPEFRTRPGGHPRRNHHGRPGRGRRRSLPRSSGGSGPDVAPASSSGSATSPIAGGGGQGSAIARARQLAAGYQPAVIKVVSYARGVARATATGQYVQREEVVLETHDGQMLADREAVTDEIRAWSAGFGRRAESQDVVAVRLTPHGVRDTEQGRAMSRAHSDGRAGETRAEQERVLREIEAERVEAQAIKGQRMT